MRSPDFNVEKLAAALVGQREPIQKVMDRVYPGMSWQDDATAGEAEDLVAICDRCDRCGNWFRYDMDSDCMSANCISKAYE